MSDRTITVGSADVPIRFDYTPAERATRADPGVPEAVDVTHVQVGDAWLSVDGFVTSAWLLEAETTLLTSIRAERRDARAEAAIAELEAVA